MLAAAAICGTALWLWHLARDSRQGAADDRGAVGRDEHDRGRALGRRHGRGHGDDGAVGLCGVAVVVMRRARSGLRMVAEARLGDIDSLLPAKTLAFGFGRMPV